MRSAPEKKLTISENRFRVDFAAHAVSVFSGRDLRSYSVRR